MLNLCFPSPSFKAAIAQPLLSHAFLLPFALALCTLTRRWGSNFCALEVQFCHPQIQGPPQYVVSKKSLLYMACSFRSDHGVHVTLVIDSISLSAAYVPRQCDLSNSRKPQRRNAMVRICLFLLQGTRQVWQSIARTGPVRGHG